MRQRLLPWQLAIALTLIGGSAIGGCRPQIPPSDAQNGQIPVTASIVPQKYFVRQIGGDRVAVQALIEPGIDPHTYELKPATLKFLANSQLYFAIGGNLEQNWLSRLKSTYPNLKVVDTSQGVDLVPLDGHHHSDRGAGRAPTHDGRPAPSAERDGNPDPHIWLSPQRVKIQAENIYQALVAADPENQVLYRANRERFLKRVDALDRELRKKLQPLKQRKFMIFHPEWGYFARDYGLEMVAIEVDGSEPSAAELAQIIQQAKAENLRLIIVQPELSERSAQAIAAEIGGETAVISAFAENWADNLRKMANILVQADISQQSALPSTPLLARAR
jgi:zinc transport system substrate-binding protein